MVKGEKAETFGNAVIVQHILGMTMNPSIPSHDYNDSFIH